jgi:pyrroline-5-carboxylate reductase
MGDLFFTECMRLAGLAMSVERETKKRGDSMNSGVSDSPPVNKARRWGFIGAGKMATALAKGMLRAGVARVETICAADPLPEARNRFHLETGAAVFDSNFEVVRGTDVLVLAVKPQSMRAVMSQLRPAVTTEHLVVSIAAGVTIASLVEGLGSNVSVVRVMPNTPALVGEGASAYALGAAVRSDDEAVVQSFLGSVGHAVRVPESLLDAVTGLSGSGPAFVYLVIEALSDGGVRAGLPRDVATLLATQTVLGAAKMVRETGEHPGALKDQVASPGGTTIAGLHALETAGVRGALIDAVVAASRRATELAALATSPGASAPRTEADR